MSDWEISASTQAKLVTVAKAIVANTKVGGTVVHGPDGFVIEGFLANGTRLAINFYKNKSVPTGNTIAGPFGPVREMSPVAGVFAIMRWLSPTHANPPQPPANSGVTLISLPSNSPIGFA